MSDRIRERISAEIDPLLGPCPPPTYASTSGLGGRRKDRCSENVDVATDKFWPVVTMRRRCSPFPERQDDGNSSAH